MQTAVYTVMEWYRMFTCVSASSLVGAYTDACEHTVPYHTCTSYRLPEDETSGSNPVADITK